MADYLTVYDREKEDLLEFLFRVPSALMQRVREIAHVVPGDVDAVGSYPWSVIKLERSQSY